MSEQDKNQSISEEELTHWCDGNCLSGYCLCTESQSQKQDEQRKNGEPITLDQRMTRKSRTWSYSNSEDDEDEDEKKSSKSTNKDQSRKSDEKMWDRTWSRIRG